MSLYPEKKRKKGEKKKNAQNLYSYWIRRIVYQHVDPDILLRVTPQHSLFSINKIWCVWDRIKIPDSHQ